MRLVSVLRAIVRYRERSECGRHTGLTRFARELNEVKGMDSGADAERAILLKETERLNRAAAANARLASLLKTAQHEHYYERERLLSEHASRLREGG
jgi:hypothetical protein